MSNQEDFFKDFPIGLHVWHCISTSQGAWRLGEVVTHHPDKWHGRLSIYSPGVKKTITVPGYWTSLIMPREVIPQVPTGTIYLVNTRVGDILSRRIPGNRSFEVFECGTRARTSGNLLGYLIIPGWLTQAQGWYMLPSYKTWLVPPNVYDLLSFLGNKLPEILDVAMALKVEEQGGKKGSADNYSVAAD